MEHTQVRSHTRNGTHVRAHRRRLPSKPAATGGGAAVLVVAIVAAIALLSHGAASSAPAAQLPVSASTTWHKAGLTYTIDTTTHDGADCAGNAYGQVRTLLAAHPCTELTRALYDTTDAAGDTMLVAVSWTNMPSHVDAQRVKDLADRSGTGNITELEPAQRPTVKFTGRHYDSTVADSLMVIITEAEPTSGIPTTDVLHQAASEALTLPRP